jgi:hypothetical protein
MGCRGYGEVVCQRALGWWETWQTKLDVLRGVSSCTRTERGRHTPLVMRVPMRVMRPLRLSERTEVSTSVEPFSEGASRAAHSSRPALSDCSVSRSWTSSHSSSRACDAACSSARRASSMGGHMAVDMAVMCFQGTRRRLLECGCPSSMARMHNSRGASRYYPRKEAIPAFLRTSLHVPCTSHTQTEVNSHRHDPSHPPACLQASRGPFASLWVRGRVEQPRDDAKRMR